MYPVGTPIRDRLEQAFRVAGIETPADSVETISMPMFLQLLQSAPMIAMLPRSMVATQLASGQLKALRSPLYLPALEYGVVTRKDGSLSASARTFVDILLDAVWNRREEQSTSCDR
jgi:DNA-binding transcriptional LysR family regulator